LLASATKNNKEVVYDALNKVVLANFRDKAIELGWITPAGMLTLNWASPVQRLIVFQALDPTIESTGKDILEDFQEHAIITHYLAWSQVEYQLKNFGKPFYDKHVQVDGKHRARYRQILSTGRLSTSSPNILNIPRKQDVYRKAVIPDDGYRFINADFDGQELFITAVLSQEPIWLDAIKNGYDLHSRNAHMIYGSRWSNAAGDDCAYFHTSLDKEHRAVIDYKKCQCPAHKEMRDNSKELSFGLIYGISAFSLAFKLKIDKEEAEMLVENFFKMLPNIKKMMDRFGRYALNNARILEPVFGRSRMFDKWKLAVPEERGGVERASYNMPIQSSGGALLKISLVLLRRQLKYLGYKKEIEILMPYHDEISIQALPEYEEEAKTLLAGCMLKSAAMAGFKGLGASAASGDSWYDAH
jgi:DNA polymerase-1